MCLESSPRSFFNTHQQIHSTRHTLVAILVSLDDASVIEKSFQQTRDGRDESCSTVLPSWILGLYSIQ